MLKRDRTGEEKKFDSMLKAGIGLLGEATQVDLPNAFRHTVVWKRSERRGQKCRIVRNAGALAQIEFEDGFIAWIDRRGIRRLKGEASDGSTHTGTSRSSSVDSGRQG